MAQRRAGRWSWWMVAVVVGAASPLASARETPARAARPRPALKARDVQLIELGRRLFHDPALSAFGERSCASCHDPEHGFSDRAMKSRDDDGLTPRHSQSLIDVDVAMPMHWDGAIASLAATTRGRMDGPTGNAYYGPSLPPLRLRIATALTELGDPAADPAAVRELGPLVAVSRSGLFPPASMAGFPGGTRVRERYANVLDTHRRLEEADAVCASAVTAYVGSLRSDTSPYDRFDAGDEGALSAAARRGLDLFQGRAGCAECHRTDTATDWWPAFRDGRYHNTGVAWLARVKMDFELLVPRISGQGDVPTEVVDALSVAGEGDPGRGAFDESPALRRAFKTPTLRDVARHPPYMHDGALATLEAVVRHYASGCGDDALRDARLRGFAATDTEVADLVAFLEALTSERRPGRPDKIWTKRASVTRLQLVDAEDRPLAGLAVTLTPAGDLATQYEAVATPFARTTDAHGRFEFPVTPFTHVRLTLPQGLEVSGGAWVPDSCREAKLVVPVRGTASVALVVPAGLEVPETLNLWRIGGSAVDLPVAGKVRSVWPVNAEPWPFKLQGKVDLSGDRVALYTGWCPNVGREMLFRLSGQRSAQNFTLEPETTVRVNVVP